MRQTAVLAATCLASLSSAAPVEKRAVNVPSGGDVTILNYALTLEYLEREFYSEGIKNFTKSDFADAGFDDTFYKNLMSISSDEQTHVKFLKGALGDSAIGQPTFSFPVTDAKSFIGLASVLEGVGVSAYLGAAASIADATYLEAAGSILTVESRHSSYIRAALGEVPFPYPFDTPLDFDSVYSLAAEFITGFAPGTSLPFKAFPPISVAATSGTNITAGTSVTFKDGYKNAIANGKAVPETKVWAVFYYGVETTYIPATISGDDYVSSIPTGTKDAAAPAGQVYVVLSGADGISQSVSDDTTISGVGILEVAEASS